MYTSVKALKRLHALRGAKSSCNGSLHSFRTLGICAGVMAAQSTARIVRSWRQPVGYALGLVGCNPSIQPEESLPKLPNGKCRQVAQVSVGVAGVFSAYLHLS